MDDFGRWMEISWIPYDFSSWPSWSFNISLEWSELLESNAIDAAKSEWCRIWVGPAICRGAVLLTHTIKIHHQAQVIWFDVHALAAYEFKQFPGMDESEPTGMRLVISLWAPRLTKSICTFCAQLGKSVPFGGITSNSPGGQGWICTSRFCKHQTAWNLVSHPLELMLLQVTHVSKTLVNW